MESIRVVFFAAGLSFLILITAAFITRQNEQLPVSPQVSGFVDKGCVKRAPGASRLCPHIFIAEVPPEVYKVPASQRQIIDIPDLL